jgi:hypothetical protein
VNHEALDSMHGWTVFAVSVSLVINLLLLAAFAYHRMTIRNYKAALVQWQRWGVQMRRNLGWSDSYLRTRVRGTNDTTRTKVWTQTPPKTPKPKGPDGGEPPPIT